MITRRLVLWLGLSQFLCWGISYYLIGVLGDMIAADLGWSKTFVYGGFSGALVVMGLTSRQVGRLIDEHGGRVVMVVGSVLTALGCAGLALSHGVLLYAASWACLGVAMRMTLYDAAFAALARIGGHSSRRAMAEVTLFGGLASTAFWPLGHALAVNFGWRGTLFCYAAIALATVPLHMAIPNGRYAPVEGAPTVTPLATTRRDQITAGALYMLMITLVSFLNAAMSAHMIGILAGLGAGAGTAVWLSSLRGIGQSAARLGEVVFGSRLRPTALAVISAGILAAAFAFGFLGGRNTVLGLVFVLAYGVGNGLLTIVRGTLPLVLFEHRVYGGLSGRLMMPSFLLSAAAPFLYAGVMETAGSGAAMAISLILAALAFGCTVVLRWRFP
jgi:hypothetical protein